MKYRHQTQQAWQLTRERFKIPDRFPPAPLREEKEIKTILSQLLKTEPPEKVLPNALAERWKIITGEQLGQHCAPVSLKNRVLYIHVDHPGWLSEIRRLPKDHLLKKISSIPDLPEITDLRFILDPAIRTWKNKR